MGRFLKMGRQRERINVCHRRPCATVAVGKRVDEFELVMKYAAGNQRVFLGGTQPLEKVIDKVRDTLGIGRIMNYLVACGHTSTTPAKPSCVVDQACLHRGMRL